jgi:hypothetical protein
MRFNTSSKARLLFVGIAIVVGLYFLPAQQRGGLVLRTAVKSLFYSILR